MNHRTHLQCDPKAIADSLRLILVPGQVTELRVLDAETATYQRPHIESGYFNDADKLAKATLTIRRAKGFYFTPNDVNPALLARAQNRIRPAGKDPTTADHDIIARRWLMIDSDPVRPAGISSSDEEHDAAIQRCREIFRFLKALGWPDPIAADSGNGAHLLYRIDLPSDDEGLVEQCLAALAERFDNDAVKIDRKVCNPARIWKLYGTPACKGDDTPARPHRMSHVLSKPAALTMVPIDLLQALVNEAPKPSAPVRRSAASDHAGDTFDLETWIKTHLPDVRGPEPWQGGRRWVLLVCPWNPAHTNGSAFIVQMPDGAIAAGCHHNGCVGKTWHDLRAMLEPDRQEQHYAQRTSGDGKPEVVLPGDNVPINEASAQLGRLLAASGDYYVRGGAAVRLAHDEQGSPMLIVVKPASLASAFENVALLRRWDKRRDLVPTTCGEAAARLVLHSEAFTNELPIVRVVTRCPVLVERTDGTLAEIVGYDRE